MAARTQPDTANSLHPRAPQWQRIDRSAPMSDLVTAEGGNGLTEAHPRGGRTAFPPVPLWWQRIDRSAPMNIVPASRWQRIDRSAPRETGQQDASTTAGGGAECLLSQRRGGGYAHARVKARGAPSPRNNTLHATARAGTPPVYVSPAQAGDPENGPQ